MIELVVLDGKMFVATTPPVVTAVLPEIVEFRNCATSIVTMPPPDPPAVLPLSVVSVRVTGFDDPLLNTPPPSRPAPFPDTVTRNSATLPLFHRPPPSSVAAVIELPVTLTSVRLNRSPVVYSPPPCAPPAPALL